MDHIDHIPRRNDLRRMTNVEQQMLTLLAQIEMLGCDVRLTDAVSLLSAARDSVADYIDGINLRRGWHFITEPE